MVPQGQRMTRDLSRAAARVQPSVVLAGIAVSIVHNLFYPGAQPECQQPARESSLSFLPSMTRTEVVARWYPV